MLVLIRGASDGIKPLHSTPIVNTTKTYLNRSNNRTRMMRQFGTSQLLLDKLTNLQPHKIQRRDSYLSRRERKPAFSKQTKRCKYLYEHRYVSEFDENLDDTIIDKGL
ncbi:hypothetical protein ACJMK2_019901 [Sinanodonta woodiana]|uniref:Uncharacterized protein n=1 Tax=Sinanodonta woodiana TaxID=1069815 RepID=A0ABD3TYE3_SINWO